MKRMAEQQLKEQLAEQTQALAKKQLTLEELTHVTGGFALELVATRSYGVKTRSDETECIEKD